MTDDKYSTAIDAMLGKGFLTAEQVDAARNEQQGSDQDVVQALLDKGLISQGLVDRALADDGIEKRIPKMALRKGLIDPEIVKILPKDKAKRYAVVPMFLVRNVLTLACADPFNVFTLDDVQTLTDCTIQPVWCERDAIMAAIDEYYNDGMEMDGFLESFWESDVEVVQLEAESLEMVEEMAEGARIINFVNLVFLNAVKEGSSDIHIEPDLNNTRVRYRIDGCLQEVMTAPQTMHAAIISRIKVMARMDIAERRQPQDGRIRIRAGERHVDLRVSTMPTVLGEKAVVRVLDRGKLILDIDTIGFNPDQLRHMKTILRRPSGIVLVTGPTGSGKTTTLYCGLKLISSIEKNIVSIEDPVEYQLELINQVQVNSQYNLTFANILRAVLRQDPDVIMLGEIRDKETAEVAIQAALTGHLVLSTLHTNESVGAIPRLTEMGIEPYLLASAIIGVVAQRLIRLVCQNCKTSYFPSPEMLQRIGWQGKNMSFVTGKGCEECFDSGLRHRQAIYEVLMMTDAVYGCVLQGAGAGALREVCVREGMRTLKDEAFRLVEDGKTTLEEVMRVVFVEEE